jgi:hypothetical protein
MPHKLTIEAEAADEVAGLAQDYSHDPSVISAIVEKMLAVADDVNVAQRFRGPGHIRFTNFLCGDSVKASVRLTFEVLSDEELVLTSCRRIQF